MKIHPASVKTIDLGYEQLFVFDGGPDTRVRVLYGGTWLTEEGASGDSFARAGDEVALHGNGRALLQGLTTTRVRIVSPPVGLGQRLRRAWRPLRRLIERLHLGERAAVAPNG